MHDLTPTQLTLREKELLDHIERLAKRHTGRLAVHVRLSKLSRAHSHDYQIRLAIDMFSGTISNLEGQLFALRNHDLVFIGEANSIPVLDKALDRLRALFHEDPIFSHNNIKPESFCVWYHLDSEYNVLLSVAREWLRTAEQSKVNQRKDPNDGLIPLQPDLLARVERNLEVADVTSMVRKQVICTFMPNKPPEALFEELYVSIHDVQAKVTPGVNWLANPLLFQYLTHTLDKRMMAMLMNCGVPDMPFSINLNVSSVLSPDFRRFDETVSPHLRGRLVIEFNKVDVFADMGAFLFARDFLHERGFRVCLDGLTHLTLPYYNRAKLGIDLIKIVWDGIEDMLPEMIPTVRSIVMEAGQARTILCRCENARAIEVGQQLGIVMFQGHCVDKLHAVKGKLPA